MIRIPLKCQCGAVRGTAQYASKSDIKRFACLCGDCQTFPQFLGNPEKHLDKNGGTEVVPAFHWNINFTSGIDQLRSIRLSSDGLLRWYTDCCKTPIGNSLSNRLPYFGLTSAIIDVADREAAFGPIVERLMGEHGIPPLPPGTRQRSSIGFLLYVLKFILKGTLARRAETSPFFNPDGKPSIAPLILSDQEYIRLRAKTHAPWRSKSSAQTPTP